MVVYVCLVLVCGCCVKFICCFYGCVAKKMAKTPYFWSQKRKKWRISAGFAGFLVVLGRFFFAFLLVGCLSFLLFWQILLLGGF